MSTDPFKIDLDDGEEERLTRKLRVLKYGVYFLIGVYLGILIGKMI